MTRKKRQVKRLTERNPHKAAARRQVLRKHHHAFVTSLRCADPGCGRTAAYQEFLSKEGMKPW